MVEVNRMTTPTNMRWKLVDQETGAENAHIQWTFRVGDQEHHESGMMFSFDVSPADGVGTARNDD